MILGEPGPPSGTRSGGALRGLSANPGRVNLPRLVKHVANMVDGERMYTFLDAYLWTALYYSQKTPHTDRRTGGEGGDTPWEGMSGQAQRPCARPLRGRPRQRALCHGPLRSLLYTHRGPPPPHPTVSRLFSVHIQLQLSVGDCETGVRGSGNALSEVEQGGPGERSGGGDEGAPAPRHAGTGSVRVLLLCSPCGP